jgi:hypothetical protein
VVPVINLPVDWQVPDVLKLRLADDEAMTVNVRTLAHTLSDADVGTISIGIPSLSVPTWFAAYGAHGGVDSSNLSNKVKWGDTTTPTITSASSFSQTELLPLAFALTANETVTWSISGGADQTQYEISGSTLRWYGNGTQDYTAPADSDGNNTYAVQVTATDLGGNSANQTITGTVTAADRTPDAFSFTPVIPATPSTQYTSNTITVAGLTPGLSVTATLTGGGAYSKNGGAYTSAAGTAQNGDTFTLRVTSGPGATDVLNLGMTIGLGSASWVVSNTTNTAAWTTSPGTSLNSNMTISGSPPLSLATAGILASQLVRANAAASSKRYLEFTLNSTPTGDIAIGVDDGTTSFGPKLGLSSIPRPTPARYGARSRERGRASARSQRASRFRRTTLSAVSLTTAAQTLRAPSTSGLLPSTAPQVPALWVTALEEQQRHSSWHLDRQAHHSQRRWLCHARPRLCF